MFSHVMIGSNDVQASRKFYDATFAVLGVDPAGYNPEKDQAYYASPTGMFAVTRPINGNPATAANGGTIAFSCESSEQVDNWHAAGVANGGTTCENPPGMREVSGMSLYLAYLRDPAGNKLCALHRPA